MRRSKRPVEWSAKIYAALVRAYPASFRRDYGDEMTFVFRELAGDAWARGGWLGLSRVWLHVLVDLARTLPQQHYFECQGALQMRPQSPLRITSLASLSIAGSFVLNVTLLAVLNGMLWVGWGSGFLTSFQHWPPSHLLATLGTLLPPFFTGVFARLLKLFYRPYLTAPVGPMMLAAAMSFADPRSPWLLKIGYPLLVGSATILGCCLSGRILRTAPRSVLPSAIDAEIPPPCTS